MEHIEVDVQTVDRLGELEYDPNVKMEPEITEPINIIQLKHGDISTEQDVVIKHSQLTQGKIIPISNSSQSDVLNGKPLIRIVSIGDTRYLSLPQTSEPLAVVIPGREFNEKPSERSSTMSKQTKIVKSHSAKPPLLSVILPRLAMNSLRSESKSYLGRKSVKSKRKSDNPLKKTDQSEQISSQLNVPDPLEQPTNTVTDISNRVLETKETLQLKEQFYQCEHCPERFLNGPAIMKHLELAHAIQRGEHGVKYSEIFENVSKEEERKLQLGKEEEQLNSKSLSIKTSKKRGVKKFVCEQCPKIFKSRDALKRHVRLHEVEREHTCKICYKNFLNSHCLIMHRRIHDVQDEDGLYPCEHCDKRFRTISGLRSHMRLVKTDKRLMCELCGMRFWRKKHLQGHMNSHTGNRPYECTQCDKRFTHDSYLKLHKQVHTDEKPYECDQCGKKFGRRSGYTKHLAIHTGKKPHFCEYCGKAFARRSHLKVHLRLHTGNNPFQCEYCNKRYPQKVQLKLHMKSHHPDKPLID